MNYYKVRAKCGHVGRNNYIIKPFFVKANDGKEAAKIVRNTPRVKHDHKYAIIDVKKITLDEYMLGLKAHANDKYFQVHNSSAQRKLHAVDNVEVFKEPKTQKTKSKHMGQRLRYEAMAKEADKLIRGGDCNEY